MGVYLRGKRVSKLIAEWLVNWENEEVERDIAEITEEYRRRQLSLNKNAGEPGS